MHLYDLDSVGAAEMRYVIDYSIVFPVLFLSILDPLKPNWRWEIPSTLHFWNHKRHLFFKRVKTNFYLDVFLSNCFPEMQMVESIS